jgi:methionyl-tRNA formyltransferase
MKKIVFMGSKPIGFLCLEFLLKNKERLGCEVVAVFSNDNVRFGSEFSVKKLAEEYNLVFGESLDDFAEYKGEVDFIISVQYHQILRREHILRAMELAINLHMAPLPEYRGCNQFSFAIYNQSKVFGTTLHRLEPGIDSGDIIAERRFEIQPSMMVKDLYDKTFQESVLLFEDKIGDILEGNYTLKPQDGYNETRTSNLYFRKDILSLKHIDLGAEAKDIALKVKATTMPGFEPPFTMIDGMKYYIIPEKYYNP